MMADYWLIMIVMKGDYWVIMAIQMSFLRQLVFFKCSPGQINLTEDKKVKP